jgi:hypothetical protein
MDALGLTVFVPTAERGLPEWFNSIQQQSQLKLCNAEAKDSCGVIKFRIVSFRVMFACSISH